ncbi:MAG: FecR domain-containing protein [Balneolaceae bacterium]|nr:FecR domain-containing protein [Balneolaceae bacterium]
MNENPNIAPDSGPDRTLAVLYGETLNGTQTPESIKDPLFNLLSESRDELVQAELSIDVQDKNRVWEELSADMTSSDSPVGDSDRGRILFLNTGSRWFKAAAAVLLIALSSLITIVLTSDSDPVLLASAETEIEVLQLQDGSTVTLRPNSSLYEISLSDNSHQYKLEGEALFSVVSNSDREFTVRADRGEVTVLGTRFNLYERNEKVRVDLFEGSVRFTNTVSSEDVILEPGEAAEITQELSLSGPLTDVEDDVSGWTQNRLAFRNRALTDVLNELEFHFGIEIRVPESLEEERLGGSIMLDSQDRALRDLGIVLGGIFVETENGKFEFENNR